MKYNVWIVNRIEEFPVKSFASLGLAKAFCMAREWSGKYDRNGLTYLGELEIRDNEGHLLY